MCTTFLWPLHFGWLLVLSLYKEDYLRIFKGVSVWLHGCCGYWEGWALVNRFNHTSAVTVVTPTDRPKSVRNRCVIGYFGCVFCVVTLLFGFFWRFRAFIIELSQISSFFSYKDPKYGLNIIFYNRRQYSVFCILFLNIGYSMLLL